MSTITIAYTDRRGRECNDYFSDGNPNGNKWERATKRLKALYRRKVEAEVFEDGERVGGVEYDTDGRLTWYIWGGKTTNAH